MIALSKFPAGVPSRTLVVWTFVGLLAISTLASAALPRLGAAFTFGGLVEVMQVQPELGLAFVGKLSDPSLSDHEQPSPAVLYAVESRKGGFIHRFERFLGSSFAFAWLKTLYEAKFPAATYETRFLLGPGHSVHDDIRQKGDGRYSIWRGHVYFSLPSGKTLGALKRFEVAVPYVSALNTDSLESIARAFRALAILSAIGLGICLVVPFARPLFRTWIFQNVAPGVLVTIVLAILVAGGAELYFRAFGMFPKDRNIWPADYVENVGFQFRPNGVLHWTNGLDFWIVQRVNSIGFLDREPTLPKPPGTFRIAIVGDSFVEAAQVPIEQKQQTILSSLLQREFPNRKIDVVALGYSGTGQSHQLAFFERHVKTLSPDLVILLFVANDFANNSLLIESVRHGWHPHHPPLLFMQKNAAGTCSRIPIASDWKGHIIQGTEVERIQRLAAISPAYKDKFAGWDPNSGHMDFVYFQSELPTAFKESFDLTKCAFLEWQKLGLPLVVVAAENVTPDGYPNSRGQIDALQEVLATLSIPLLDLRAPFLAKGSLKEVRWKFDGHWTPTGHKWAAESMFEFLKQKHYFDSPPAVR